MLRSVKKKKNASKLFYACYLLLSAAPQTSNIVYVGSTPDPIRRLRQHNGEITGGAKKTVKKRPWNMVIVVYGFPSRLAALQFEWAWQHPHKSRHFKAQGPEEHMFTGRQKERQLPTKLDALSRMFHLEHYKRWPLHLHFTSDAIYAKFKTFKPLPSHVRVTTGSLATIPIPEDQKGLDSSADASKTCYCSICELCIDLDSSQNWLQCSRKTCPMFAHIICLSNHFLENDKSAKSLIPIQGVCPYCEKDLKWGELILSMKSRKMNYTSSAILVSEVPETQLSSEDSDFERVVPITRTAAPPITPKKKVGTKMQLASVMISDSESEEEMESLKRSISSLNL